jgi:hypothetical protein
VFAVRRFAKTVWAGAVKLMDAQKKAGGPAYYPLGTSTSIGTSYYNLLILTGQPQYLYSAIESYQLVRGVCLFRMHEASRGTVWLGDDM